MIISDLTIENFGPFKDRVRLDLRPTKLKDGEDMVMNIGNGDCVLSSVVVFGANASGKSSIIDALSAVTSMMSEPRPDDGRLPYNPFRLSPETKDLPTEIGISFYESSIRYEYNIKFNETAILEEGLHYYPEGNRRLYFSRKGNGFRFPRSKDSKKLTAISQTVGRESSFIPVAGRFDDDVCKRISEASRSIRIVKGDMKSHLKETIAWMNADPRHKELLVRSLSLADFDIDDLDGYNETHETENPDGCRMSKTRTHLRVRHGSETEGPNGDDAIFPLSMESSGTLQMIGIMGPVIDTLISGGVVAIDEFGSSLDTDICRWILNLFRGDRNTLKAQLLVNTHNIMLMDTEILRRDQIYFASKDRDTKASDLYSLSDFGIRKSYDPRKGYVLGKFDQRPLTMSERWLDEE